jgi:hypothetical protein
MSCSAKQIAIKAGQAALAAVKSEYDNALGALKSLAPGGFPTRQDFEAAKALAHADAKVKLAAYKAQVGTLAGLCAAILPLDLLKVEAITNAEEVTNTTLAAGLTSGAAAAAAIAKSVLDKALKDNLLC